MDIGLDELMSIDMSIEEKRQVKLELQIAEALPWSCPLSAGPGPHHSHLQRLSHLSSSLKIKNNKINFVTK